MSTSIVRTEHRTSGFASALSEITSAASWRFDGAPAMDARIRSVRDGDLVLGRIHVADPPAYAAAGRPATAAPAARYAFCYQVAGAGTVTQDGRTAAVQPGDIFVYSLDRACEMEFSGTPSERVALLAPTSAMGTRSSVLSGLTGTRLLASSGLVAAVGRAVDDLERVLFADGPTAQGAVMQLVLHNFATLCIEAVVRGAVTDTRSEYLARALQLIERELGDPDLSPGRIAREMHISVRQLHRVFAAGGVPVAATIRRARLARARLDLQEPDTVTGTAADIASRCGFGSPSQFSALFAQAFGTSPSAYRRDHVLVAVH